MLIPNSNASKMGLKTREKNGIWALNNSDKLNNTDFKSWVAQFNNLGQANLFTYYEEWLKKGKPKGKDKPIVLDSYLKLGGKLIPKHQQGRPILYNRPIAEYTGKPVESLIYTDAMLKGATPEQLEAYEILGKADSQCSKSSGLGCEKAWNKLRAIGLYAPDSYESFKKSMNAKQISLGNKPTINWETGQVIDTEQFDAETDSWNILGKGKQLGWEIHDIGSKDFDKTKFLEALKNLPIGATLHSGSYSDSSKQTLNQKEGFSNVSHTMRVVGFSERGNPVYYDFGTLKELTLDDYDVKRIRAIAIPTEFKDYTYRNLLNYQPTMARKKGGSLIPKK